MGGESGREIVFKGKRILLYVPLLGSCLAAKEADKSGDNLQLAMEPTETECVSRVAHPGHKHSSTSVMTEASVVPLSGGPIDEITSIADVASLETKSEIDPSSSSSPLTTAGKLRCKNAKLTASHNTDTDVRCLHCLCHCSESH